MGLNPCTIYWLDGCKLFQKHTKLTQIKVAKWGPPKIIELNYYVVRNNWNTLFLRWFYFVISCHSSLFRHFFDTLLKRIIKIYKIYNNSYVFLIEIVTIIPKNCFWHFWLKALFGFSIFVFSFIFHFWQFFFFILLSFRRSSYLILFKFLLFFKIYNKKV